MRDGADVLLIDAGTGLRRLVDTPELLNGVERLDIVLTDHSLRGDNGAGFIARLRELRVTCPVVMVTGSSDPKVHEQAYAAGATRVRCCATTATCTSVRRCTRPTAG